MKSNVTQTAYQRATISTINSLFALAVESADVISIRIEFSSKMRLLNVLVFSETTTHHAYNIVLLDDEKALEDLLQIEDDLIERIALRRDIKEAEAA
ncbi:hypothetical protein HB762_20240 [Vibrio campbellii]|uniref:Uncharacterized protein n=1 Tax=Vibrio campbellii TaxID=680 RepID=A0ABY5IHK3_9VIBR|nr:hypothetical protein [Vibrio campbellii]UTZ33604.1 hypothetical protein HB762_20240 [Vibrio campbellii]